MTQSFITTSAPIPGATALGDFDGASSLHPNRWQTPAASLLGRTPGNQDREAIISACKGGDRGRVWAASAVKTLRDTAAGGSCTASLSPGLVPGCVNEPSVCRRGDKVQGLQALLLRVGGKSQDVTGGLAEDFKMLHRNFCPFSLASRALTFSSHSCSVGRISTQASVTEATTLLSWCQWGCEATSASATSGLACSAPW